MYEYLLENGWVIWLALLLLFGVCEMFTLELTFAMLALGAVGGLVTTAFTSVFWIQVVVACALALILLAFVRRPLLRVMHLGADETPTGVAAIYGADGVAVGTVTAEHGLVKLSNGETWTARASGATIEDGTHVVVTAIDGASVSVRPKE